MWQRSPLPTALSFALTAHLLSLGCAANERRQQDQVESSGGVPYSPGGGESYLRLYGASDGFDRTARSSNGFELTARSSHGFDRTATSTARSSPDLARGASSFEWQLPLPPVRFPLRDALLALQEPQQPTPRSATAAARAAATAPPMVVVQTEKSKALRALGKWKRSGADFAFRIDRGEAPLQPPRVPAAVLKTAPGPKSVACLTSMSKQAHLRGSETAGKSLWLVKQDPSKQFGKSQATLLAEAALSDSRGFEKYTMRPWLHSRSTSELQDNAAAPGREAFVAGRVRQPGGTAGGF